MKPFLQYKGQLFCTLVLFLVVLAMPFQDYLEQTLSPEALHSLDGDSSLIEYTEESLTVPETAGSLTLESGAYGLKKGSYLVVFNLLAHEEGGTVEIRDPFFVNPDGSSGRLLSSADIPVTEESIRLKLTIEEPRASVQFRINSKGALNFSSIYLLSEKGLFSDPYVYACLLLLASALLLLFRTRLQLQRETLVILGFTALWSSLPLFLPMLPVGERLPLYYARLLKLSEILPVGMSPIGLYQLLLLCLNLATTVFSYAAFSRLFRSQSLGLLAALAYTLFPLRLAALYGRAALTEVLILALLPLLIGGLCRLLFSGISPAKSRPLLRPFYKERLLSFASAWEWRQLLLILGAVVMVCASGSYYHRLFNEAELLHWNQQMEAPGYTPLEKDI